MEQVPAQKKGARSDIEYSVNAGSEAGGAELYERAKKNLLQVNSWHLLTGKISARFLLTGPFGEAVKRLPLQGDFIRIHLPSSAPDTFEWVRIEQIEERKLSERRNRIMIRVRPSDAPKKQEETEHFFSKDATSSFIVERDGKKVTAAVHGRNELPNTDEPEGFFRKIRNAVIAVAAMAGMNTPQWKGLVMGILNKDIGVNEREQEE